MKTPQEYEEEINQLTCTVEALTQEINERRTEKATGLLLDVLNTLNEDETGAALEIFEPLLDELSNTLEIIEEQTQDQIFDVCDLCGDLAC